jgi:hypothetical protein
MPNDNAKGRFFRETGGASQKGVEFDGLHLKKYTMQYAAPLFPFNNLNNTSPYTLLNCIFENIALNGNPLIVYSQGKLRLENCTFRNVNYCVVKWMGDAHNDIRVVEVVDSKFYTIRANVDGGGGAIDVNNVSLLVEGCRFEDCVANPGQGGKNCWMFLFSLFFHS